MASLQWTDAEGTDELTGVLPSPVSVFSEWVPFRRVVGPRHHALANGRPYKYAFRTEYGASFRLEHIAMEDADLAARLLAHLESGGSVTVATNDLFGNSYTAYLADGGDTEGALSRAGANGLVEYVLSLKLINGSEAAMSCVYDVQPTRDWGS